MQAESDCTVPLHYNCTAALLPSLSKPDDMQLFDFGIK